MSITDFTYDAYTRMLQDIKNNGYTFTDYHYYQEVEEACILRHDVDLSLEKAVLFAEKENIMNVKSTYFVLLNTDFYNLLSKKGQELIAKIRGFNHEIGLHFDEKAYNIFSSEHLELIPK